ncbi:CDP-diacylglycerol--serine O-phosphatidyltransferase [Stieleria marina]|uniref:CDP-diacylglycerol--serine O-phosphatidyltransferase n=1 Tax=Stieleria marina TaxID=1930275 RepID=A0A517NRE4_9BACT|nr:CDP-diacylglycerol--inositol 3-phosphatidyltransferase [Planctomycetes bacterium K23_9]
MSELKHELFPRRQHSTDADSVDSAAENENVEVEGNQSKTNERVLTGSSNSRRRKKRKRKKKPRRLTLAVLPTLLTLGNAVCGLAAIAILVSNSESLAWVPEQKLFVAGLLIYGGMLFDALDGSAARMTGQASQFGAELDSLCDAVTFGTAPAVLIWRLSDVLPQRLTWGIGVLFTLCVLIRLARFNVETGEDDPHDGFEGLPSPAAAGTVAAFAIAIPELNSVAADALYPERIRWLAQNCLEASHYVIPILALVLAYLMVSRYQYPHIFQQWIRGRRPMHQIGQALFALFGIFLLHWLALPLVLSYFAFASPIRSLAKRQWSASPVQEQPDKVIESDDEPETNEASAEEIAVDKSTSPGSE